MIKVFLTHCFFLLFLSFSKECCVSWLVFPSHLLGPCFLLLEKCYLLVVFALWKYDCWSMYPGSIWQKNNKFLIEQQNLPFNNIQSVKLFCQCPIPKCYFQLTSLVWRHNYAPILYTHIQNENCFLLCGKKQWPVEKKRNNRLAHTY